MLNINKIRMLGKRMNLTQDALVKKIGITKSTYHNLLKSGDFRISHLEKMAEIFEVDICEFFKNDDNNYSIKTKGSTVNEDSVDYGKNEKIASLEKEIELQEEIIKLLKKG